RRRGTVLRASKTRCGGDGSPRVATLDSATRCRHSRTITPMSGNAVEHALSVVELLASHPSGVPLSAVTQSLAIPKSGAHRLLALLIGRGYVRQDAETARYLLTTKIVSVGFRYLAASGVGDVVQPTLERLARDTGELVRLGVIDGARQTWVA